MLLFCFAFLVRYISAFDSHSYSVITFVFVFVKNLYSKKRSGPANERQKPANSYARMFAAQKEKKAKEAKENEGKPAQNDDSNQARGATQHFNGQVHPQVHMDANSYGGHLSVGWTVDNNIHPSYDHAVGM